MKNLYEADFIASTNSIFIVAESITDAIELVRKNYDVSPESVRSITLIACAGGMSRENVAYPDLVI